PVSGEIGLWGRSRGAECVLNVASYAPAVRAVVAVAPSHLRWIGLQGSGTSTSRRSAWTYRGEPLPHARTVGADEPGEWTSVGANYERGLAGDPVELAKAEI